MIPSDFQTWLVDPARRPLVMGVLNVTPDSFSDGGRFADADRAIAHANEMIEAGADVIDIGGESTRPGSERVSSQLQIDRVVPVIRTIAKQSSSRPITFSIDTTRADVARAAIDEGAAIINDISAGNDDGTKMFELAAARRTPIVLMHMLGSPLTMQVNPTYENDDAVTAVERYLTDRLAAARNAGIDESRVLFDPGLGFGKKFHHSFALLRETARLAKLGRPLVVGASRKRFIGAVTGEADPTHRLFGSAAAIAYAVANGAAIVRVHDVRPMKQVVDVIRAIQTGEVDDALK